MPVNQVTPSGARGCPGKYGPSTSAVLLQAAGNVDAGVPLIGELDIRVGFVVAQQDVEARLVLLDEIVFEGECLFFVVDQDVVDSRASRDEPPVLASASRSSLK